LHIEVHTVCHDDYFRDVSAAEFLPTRSGLTALRAAARECRGCELYKRATQTVFGAGARRADIMLVGEQPGDREDIEGKPFVGPAGHLLDRALLDAGIDKNAVYVTNAVKHFKWVQRGKRRLHDRPRAGEVHACHPWLEAEMAAVAPKIVICLGATAALAVLGTRASIASLRGRPHMLDGHLRCFVTSHPSAILRAPSAEERARALRRFTADLRAAALPIGL
jgi:uracil-DNA glycosylase family protein